MFQSDESETKHTQNEHSLLFQTMTFMTTLIFLFWIPQTILSLWIFAQNLHPPRGIPVALSVISPVAIEVSIVLNKKVYKCAKYSHILQLLGCRDDTSSLLSDLWHSTSIRVVGNLRQSNKEKKKKQSWEIVFYEVNITYKLHVTLYLNGQKKNIIIDTYCFSIGMCIFRGSLRSSSFLRDSKGLQRSSVIYKFIK